MDCLDVPGMVRKVALVERRLLIVANELESFFNHRLPAARAAQAAGYDVHVALQEAQAARARDVDGMTFHALPLSRGFASPRSEIAALAALHWILGEVRPDIIHAFTLKPALCTSIAARIRKLPVVVSVTGLGSFFLGNRMRDRIAQCLLVPVLRQAFTYKRMFAIVQNSDDRVFAEKVLKLPKQAVTLVPGSGVDLEQFSPRAHLNTAQTNGSYRVRIVLASRMLADKGVKEFVAAAALMRADGINAEFVLAGGLDPSNRSAILTGELETWTASQTVTWIGKVTDMPALYAASDVACLPSYREGLPKALIEAAACGLPIVTTDVPGCREVIIHGETGILVPARDPQALATALRKLIMSADQRIHMGAAGRRRAEKLYGNDIIAGQILAVYQRLLDGTAASTTR